MKEKIIQKIMGIFCILAGIIMIYAENDITIAVVSVPLGLYLLFTRKIVIEL